MCILQDSRRDWEIESGRMAAVYEQSYVTIVASSAETSEAGFLGARHAKGTTHWTPRRPAGLTDPAVASRSQNTDSVDGFPVWVVYLGYLLGGGSRTQSLDGQADPPGSWQVADGQERVRTPGVVRSMV